MLKNFTIASQQQSDTTLFKNNFPYGYSHDGYFPKKSKCASRFEKMSKIRDAMMKINNKTLEQPKLIKDTDRVRNSVGTVHSNYHSQFSRLSSTVNFPFSRWYNKTCQNRLQNLRRYLVCRKGLFARHYYFSLIWKIHLLLNHSLSRKVSISLNFHVS